MSYYQFAFIFFIFLITGCKKDIPIINEPISTIPKIEWVSINKTTIQQFADSIVFTIKFTDAGGDIGDVDADSTSLILSDSRDATLIEKYHIPVTAPANSNINVQGQFSIVLKNTILLHATNTNETTTYIIKLRDRSGHWSNEITSETITITP
jgi:hypothetical protein